MPLSDAWIDFVAGWCSGAAAVVVCQPLDTVLTRWQAATVTSVVPQGNAATIAATNWRQPTSSLIATAGWRALWRGAWPMMSAVPVQNALLMGGYGVGQQWWLQQQQQRNGGNNSTNNDFHRLVAILVGGTTGGILQSFVMSPVEFIKVAQQTNAKAIHWRPLLQAHPARGLGATLLRDGLPHGVWFVSYDVFKDALVPLCKADGDDTDDLPVMVPLSAGAGAATVAWLVGYPADLIKTRIQANAAMSASGSVDGIMATARTLIAEANGSVTRGLYRGLGLKLWRAIPASMIGFGVYEAVKAQIEKY